MGIKIFGHFGLDIVVYYLDTVMNYAWFDNYSKIFSIAKR